MQTAGHARQRQLPSTPTARRVQSVSSLHDIARTTPTSSLLLVALAVSAVRTWIRSSASPETGGGEGWLVVSYWAWRLSSDARRRWKGKKGRRKDIGVGLSFSLETCVLATGLSVQVVSFILMIGSLGPLRAMAILSAVTTCIAPSSPRGRSVVGMIPGLIASVIIFMSAFSASAGSIIPPTLFAVSSVLLPTLVARSQGTSRTKDKPSSTPSSGVNVLASMLSLLAVWLLWQMDIIPSPLPNIVHPNAHLFGAFFIALLARYMPVSRVTTGSRMLTPMSSSRDHLVLIIGTAAIQFFALPPAPTQLDAFCIIPLLLAGVFANGPQARRLSEVSFGGGGAGTSTGYWSAMSLLPPSWRPHLQTILRTPTSKKIFYFLLLNLAYMGVQMAYGVLTNSLGLISDAIHMLFDCLGLAVGLWASVAATWKPDGRYTYGYARVETLSGFANGCFLILISIFIIFEAIQRVLDPPEMETRQLLLVSSIGLAINLWGMYATGGHHHHGHGHGHAHDHGHDHSHGHSHGHAHGHAHVHEKKEDHWHVHGQNGHPHVHAAHDHHTRNGRCDDHSRHAHHDHDDLHAHHDHGHQHDHAHDAHDVSHAHSHDDAHGPGHDHAHSHNMRGVFLHVLADTLGSVGVIISTILIRLTGWTGFDPLASLFIALLIMASVVPLVIDSGKVLCLDVGSESEKQIRAALTELASVSGLANYASPRFWPRCEGELSGSIHIHLAPSPSAIDPFHQHSHSHRHDDTIYANADRVVARVEKVLKGRIRGLTELVIQVEGSEDQSFCSCMTGSS